MGLYAGQDLAVTAGGDLEVGGNGDLLLASEVRTVAQHAAFLVRTDHGDYRPDVRVGCNLGTLIGRSNTPETKALVRSYVREELEDKVFHPGDAEIKLALLDPYMLLLAIKAAGTFMDSSYNLNEQEVRLAFEFPYLDRAPEPIGTPWS